MSPKLIARPVLSNLLRRRALVLGAMGVAACAAVVAAPATLYAQSISFAGVQTTVSATGLSNPIGVAVDGVGDVFMVFAFSFFAKFLFLFLLFDQAAIFCLLAASALSPMAQMKPSSSRPTAVMILRWSLPAAASRM